MTRQQWGVHFYVLRNKRKELYLKEVTLLIKKKFKEMLGLC